MKTKTLALNLCLVFSMLFCLAFACNDGSDRGGTTTGDTTTTTTTTTTAPTTRTEQDAGVPTEQDVRDVFTKLYANREITFGNIQIKPTLGKSYTSNLGVYVHGYPVRLDYTLPGAGYGYQNGKREIGGIYYFYQDDFGAWNYFVDTAPTETTY